MLTLFERCAQQQCRLWWIAHRPPRRERRLRLTEKARIARRPRCFDRPFRHGRRDIEIRRIHAQRRAHPLQRLQRGIGLFVQALEDDRIVLGHMRRSVNHSAEKQQR